MAGKLGRLGKLDINGNPYLGVYCKCSERMLAVPPIVPGNVREKLAAILDVEVKETTLGGSIVLGALMSMNSNGVVVTNFAEKKEVERLVGASQLNKLDTRMKALHIPDRLNAVGNNILANDSGAIIHPDFGKKAARAISDTLGVEVVKGTIGGLKTVGSAAVSTNRGVLCHPYATPDELEKVKEVLRVPAKIGTVNFGTPLIGACLLANSRGVVVGSKTTSIELGRIEDTLGFLD